MAMAMALLWALAAKESCSVPTAPLTSMVVGAAPMPEAAKLSVPSLALATTCTVTLTVPFCGNLGRIDGDIGDVGAVDATGGVVQRSVEQFHAVERRRVGDPVDAVENRIDLQAGWRPFPPGESAPLLAAWLVRLCNCRSIDEISFSAPSAVLSTLPACWRVADRLIDAVDFGLERLAGDQAGRIVLAAVDFQTGREPLQARANKAAWFRFKALRACSELILVLI